MQRKLAPNPTGVLTQNVTTASTVNNVSIKGRLNDLRSSSIEDSIQNTDISGISSGDSYVIEDSTLWLKRNCFKD